MTCTCCLYVHECICQRQINDDNDDDDDDVTNLILGYLDDEFLGF